jgi:hypothetical protein
MGRAVRQGLIIETAHFLIKPGSPCRRPVSAGADQEWQALESPATKEGRCRLRGGASGSGGPPGERNGQYRHGERTGHTIDTLPNSNTYVR